MLATSPRGVPLELNFSWVPFFRLMMNCIADGWRHGLRSQPSVSLETHPAFGQFGPCGGCQKGADLRHLDLGADLRRFTPVPLGPRACGGAALGRCTFGALQESGRWERSLDRSVRSTSFTIWDLGPFLGGVPLFPV